MCTRCHCVRTIEFCNLFLSKTVLQTEDLQIVYTLEIKYRLSLIDQEVGFVELTYTDTNQLPVIRSSH